MIKCAKLTIVRNRRKILDGIDLDLTGCRHWLVWGGNGAGKTTLARALAGLIEPDSGQISRDPVLQTPLPMLFQDPDAQIAAATVRDEIALGARSAGEPQITAAEPGPAGRRLATALQDFRLDHLAWRHPHALSGGEKRRLNLAALTVLESSALILDEPELHLDPRAWREWSTRLEDWLTGDDRFLLEISRLPERLTSAEGLIVLHEGRLFMAGEPEMVYRRAVDAGLAIPRVETWEKVTSPGVRFGDADGASIPDPVAPAQSIPDGVETERGSTSSRNDGGDPEREMILTAKNIQLQRPDGGSPILDDLDLELVRGEKLLITGGNGSGKTSLLLLLADLADPDRGEIRRWQGLTSVMVFQNPERSCFAETVREEIEFGPRRQGLRSDELTHRAESAMFDLGLPEADFARRDPFTLSAGELRRVALASMLAMDVELLIMDEPSSALDGAGCASLAGALERWPGSLIWADCQVPAGFDRLFTRRLELSGSGRLTATS